MIPLLMMMKIWGTMTAIRSSRAFLKEGFRALSGHDTVFTKYVPSEGPFFPNCGLKFFVLTVFWGV